MTSINKVQVKNLYKVFGENPNLAMQMIKNGQNKDQIFQQTGMVLGVRDATFDVGQGEIFVLMGLSGSGKSTLIRLLNRLVEPTAGEVLLDGRDVAQLDEKSLINLRRKDMAMVFQSFALLPHLTVLQNTAFGLEVAGVAKSVRERRAYEVLEQVGLKAFAGKKPSELSGGMQQRVGLARALAVDPSLMLMDEAFSALDPLKRTEMQELLLQLQKEQQRTIVFVSHDLDEAFKIGNRIAIMEGGRIVQVGTPDEILRNPSEEYVRAFFKGVDVKKYFVAQDLVEPADIFNWSDFSSSTATEICANLLEKMHQNGQQKIYLTNSDGSLLGQVLQDELRVALGNQSVQSGLWKPSSASSVNAFMPMHDLAKEVVKAKHSVAVVDAEQKILGQVSQAGLLSRLVTEEE